MKMFWCFSDLCTPLMNLILPDCLYQIKVAVIFVAVALKQMWLMSKSLFFNRFWSFPCDMLKFESIWNAIDVEAFFIWNMHLIAILGLTGWRDIMMTPSVVTAGEQNHNNNNNHGRHHGGGQDLVKEDLHQQQTDGVNGAPYFITSATANTTVEIIKDKNDSHCSSVSDGESYECYGEVDMDTSSPNNLITSEGNQNGTANGNSLKRNTWFRTSLRRNQKNNENLPNRRWGSFRHTSGKRLAPSSLTGGGGGLQRSSSFNSSGRSSTCDTVDDVCSDISLEEDVLDLSHKVQMLQQQMNVLADNQNHSDERYTRARQENAALQARIHMLEEQLRETELRSEERLQDEERRHRELMNRVDREKQLQVENCTIRLHTLELENTTLKEEAVRCRTQADRLRADKEALEDRLEESKETINSLTEEIGSLQEQQRKEREQNSHNQQLIEEMSSEIDRLRKEQKACIEEISIRSNGVSNSDHQDLQAQLCQLRQENKRLEEAHDEMQALLLTRSVEEGRTLLTENKSLAAELEAMSQDEHGVNGQEEIEVRGALKEQQEVNLQLRAYIDGILLNIVENYPQLLEVKPNP